MKSDWTFKDHLLVSGSATINTAGSNLSSITVDSDFYIGGAFHTNNHNKVNVGGNLLVMGDLDIGTNSEITVEGNALFDYKVSNVQPHAVVTIQKNAYFKNPLIDSKGKRVVHQNATFCVKGDIYLWKNNKWAPYLPTDPGYGGFEKSCISYAPTNPDQQPGNIYNWLVQPPVNARYR